MNLLSRNLGSALRAEHTAYQAMFYFDSILDALFHRGILSKITISSYFYLKPLLLEILRDGIITEINRY